MSKANEFLNIVNEGKKAINPLIRQIVGRRHVGESDEDVIHYVISRLKKGQETFDAMPKADQKELIRQIKAAHAENKKLYRSVMSGKF